MGLQGAGGQLGAHSSWSVGWGWGHWQDWGDPLGWVWVTARLGEVEGCEKSQQGG